ncbi:MAG: T9SS type A sorting domain-containing protein [Bacteroidetes bacterium]|nr:T9SS type A sorting domain-containing protein [Bacteroidota bacterium]
MRIDNFNDDTQGTTDDLRTPVLDLANVIAPITVTFDVAYARYDAQYSDTLGVYVSTDCGITWTQVFLKGGTTLSTAPDNTNAFTPNTNQWRAESVSLNAYAGQSGVIVAFRARGGYGNFLYVDNINITSGTTSINEVVGLNAAVYPNPSNDGIFTVDVTGVLSGNEMMEVTDVTGRVIYTTTLNGIQRQAIDLSGEAQGVYFFSVRGYNQNIHRRLLYVK